MNRLVRDGLCCSWPRAKDQCYCYTLKGYNPKNQKNEHQLKIVDAAIELNCYDHCVIEPTFGVYEPDLFYKDHFNRLVCVEVQLTKISAKRMQEKVNNFIKEKQQHGAGLLYIVSDHNYNDIRYDQTKAKINFMELPKEKTL
jgi:hypothetical protein